MDVGSFDKAPESTSARLSLHPKGLEHRNGRRVTVVVTSSSYY